MFRDEWRRVGLCPNGGGESGEGDFVVLEEGLEHVIWK